MSFDVNKNYTQKLMFLRDVINAFTKNLAIQNKSFYDDVKKYMYYHSITKDLSYTPEGLQNSGKIIEACRNSRNVYGFYPYLNAFTSLLDFIYKKSYSIMGEVTKSVFAISLEQAENKYPGCGFARSITEEMIQKKPKDVESPYSITVMDNMIEFLVEKIIKPHLKSQEELEEIRNSKTGVG
jgi:hypothetical protein